MCFFILVSKIFIANIILVENFFINKYKIIQFLIQKIFQIGENYILFEDKKFIIESRIATNKTIGTGELVFTDKNGNDILVKGSDGKCIL